MSMATTPQQQEEEDDMVRGEAAAWECLFGFVDAMALRCALKLRIPDIISSHGGPISLSQISNNINHPSLDIDRLSRVMTILVRRGIFGATPSDSGSSTLYSLTAASKLFRSDPEEKSLAPLAMYHSSEFCLSLWQEMDGCVMDGGSSTGFTKRCGMDAWSYMSANPEHCTMFQQFLASMSKIVMEALKIGYLHKNGLDGVGSLVDLGGGNGVTISEIVREIPRIKGINFDLSFVVAAAPEYPGTTHVAGDMFVSVPPADAILIKLVLHNWNDENCIKILANCRKAIPKETGKLIIVDVVLDPYGKDPFDHAKVAFDLTMMLRHGAKERTKGEWSSLLQAAGFSRHNIIKIPTFVSVIEAYP